jgi:Zn-dependent protease/predicted transcriptional regulator
MSLKLGRILGIPVRIHYTLWLVFLLIAWSLASGYMPRQYPGLDVVTYWAIGVASALLLFVSVLVHELAHSYIAKKNGLPITRITLFFFGGVSEIGEEPKNPRLEVRMAAAGPLTSFVIAGIFAGLWYLNLTVSGWLGLTATFQYAALINAMLGAFNLVPAFPLDGGRVLRGALWNRSGNLLKATSLASRIGEAFAYAMMLGGFLAIFLGDLFNGIWFLFLGWFLRSGAEASKNQTVVSEALAGLSVGDVMTHELNTVAPDMIVQRLVSEYFLVHTHGGYPVVQNGRLLGIVTLQCVRALPRDQWNNKTVGDIMVSCERAVTIQPEAAALDAMAKMARQKVGRLLVTGKEGQLQGILTNGDLMRAIRVRIDLSL